MRMTPHAYNVTWCSDACETMLFPYNDDGGSGAAFMNISIPGLSEATPTSIHISSSVVRNDSLTGRNTTLQSRAIVVQLRAGNSNTNDTTTTTTITFSGTTTGNYNNYSKNDENNIDNNNTFITTVSATNTTATIPNNNVFNF